MPQTPVRIGVLGRVRAWRDGEPVALRGISARTVLACLALRPGTVVSVSALSEALWGDDPPSRATANLQTTISRLRSGLGTAAIETTPAGYRLWPEGLATDLGDLEDLLSRVDGLPPGEAVDRLSEALDSWEGSALGDVAPTPYFDADRIRLEELHLVARDRLGSQLLAADRPDAAVVELQRAAHEAPLRESTQLLLAESLHLAGRDAEALRVVDRYRRRLADETGLDPSPAVADCEQWVLSGDSGPTDDDRFVALQVPRSSWLPPDTPFVGRNEQLADLKALTLRHRLVTVVGPGGVGKSRLVMELLQQLDAVPAVVVLLAAVDPDASVEAALAAELGLEMSADSLTDALAERLRLRPTLIVLDNCEHVLEASARIIDGLLRRVEGLRVVATSRRRLGLSEEQLLLLDPLVVPSEADGEAPVVRLLCDRVARSAPRLRIDEVSPGLLVDICRLLDGLPLALELAAARAHLLGLEGLRTQLLEGRLPRVAGAQTMSDAVAWSLDLLGAQARDLFAEACAFPATFTGEALVEISAVDDPTSALAELVEASLVVVEVGDTGRPPRYRILEPIRQVGRPAVPSRAVDAYLRWVGALGDRVEQLFASWREPLAHSLIAEHRDNFRHAMAVLADRHDDDASGRLARCLARPLMSRPELDLVEVILDRVPSNTDGLVARVVLEWHLGRFQDAADHADLVLERLDPADPRVPIVLLAVGPAFSFLGRIDRMIASARRAAEHSAAPASVRVAAVGLWALGEHYAGDTCAARKVLADHETTLQQGQMCFISFVRAELVAQTDPAAALRWLEQGSQHARRDLDFLGARMVEIAKLSLLVTSRDHAIASTLARRLVDELLLAGLMPQAWMALRHVAALLYECGEPLIAIQILDSAAASTTATELVGEAVHEEADLRRRIQHALGFEPREGLPAQPIEASELWPKIDHALARLNEP